MIEVTVSEARDRLAELLGQVEHASELVTITKHGRPIAAIVPMGDLAFMERVCILAAEAINEAIDAAQPARLRIE